MKKFIGNIAHKMRDYWRHLMRSRKENKMSHGAAQEMTMITYAHKDGWRRKESPKKPSHKDK